MYVAIFDKFLKKVDKFTPVSDITPYVMHTNHHVATYRIMQIVRGGKVLQLHDLFVIRGKTFAIVQQLETPYNKKDKNSLKNLRDWRLIRENRESFPLRTICIIRG